MKSRVVSFRLSEAEYIVVEQASRQQGCASVALFARFAALNSAGEGGRSARMINIRGLRQSLQTITVALDSVAATLHVVLKGVSEPGGSSGQGITGESRPMELNIA